MQLHGWQVMVGSEAVCFSLCWGVIWKVCVCPVHSCAVLKADVKQWGLALVLMAHLRAMTCTDKSECPAPFQQRQLFLTCDLKYL